ncbi:MAG: glycosyltransferase, partial [Planctomycetota bacterium]
ENLIEEEGYKVFYLSNIELINAFRFSILFKLIRILKDHKIDILHCHRHKPSFYGALAGMLAKTPVVLSHVHGLSRTRNIGRKLLNFFAFRRVNRIVGCAGSVRDSVLKDNPSVRPEKVVVLENSVDFERFDDVLIAKADAKQMLGLLPDAFVFGTIARLTPTKGLSYLIEAFREVKKQKPSAHLVLLGDGRCRAELEEQASNMSCSDAIHFLGHRDNIEQLLKGMDIFVLSSVAEGMPLVILEAMAAGIPCIATEVGGIPEIISGNDVGVLVPSKDSEALAEAMIKLAKITEKKRQNLIDNAREKVHNCYSHEVVMKKLEDIYQTEITHYCESSRR